MSCLIGPRSRVAVCQLAGAEIISAPGAVESHLGELAAPTGFPGQKNAAPRSRMATEGLLFPQNNALIAQPKLVRKRIFSLFYDFFSKHLPHSLG